MKKLVINRLAPLLLLIFALSETHLFARGWNCDVFISNGVNKLGTLTTINRGREMDGVMTITTNELPEMAAGSKIGIEIRDIVLCRSYTMVLGPGVQYQCEHRGCTNSICRDNGNEIWQVNNCKMVF